MNAVLEHILRHDPDDATLLEALAILYSHEKKYDRALAMYLKYVPSVAKLSMRFREVVGLTVTMGTIAGCSTQMCSV